MDILKSDEISKKYYSIKEACAIINQDLNLKVIDYINSVHLNDWNKKDWIKYSSTRARKIHIDDLNKIKEFVFFHTVLGIKGSKVKEVKQYIKEEINKSNSNLFNYLYEITK